MVYRLKIEPKARMRTIDTLLLGNLLANKGKDNKYR